MMSLLWDILGWIANFQILGKNGNILGFLWLMALTIFGYVRFKQHFQNGGFPKPTDKRWRSILWHVAVLNFSLLTGLFVQYVIDDGITTPVNLYYGSWVEASRGGFTLLKLLSCKWDIYVSIIIIVAVFCLCGTWRFFHFTKQSLFWLVVMIMFQFAVSSHSVWDYTLFSGSYRTIIFWLVYPAFRVFSGFFTVSIIKKPITAQDTLIEKAWFNNFDSKLDVREESEFPKVFSAFGIDKKPRGLMLDAGCGYGSFATHLDDIGYSVIGSDVSHRMIMEMKKAGDQNCQEIVSDLSFLPFQDGTFDYVFCAGTLHHFRNLGHVLLEVKRTLKVNGRFFIYEPNGSNPLLKIVNSVSHRLFPSAFLMKMGATPNERLHSLKSYAKDLESVKFTIEKASGLFVDGRTFLPFGLNSLVKHFHLRFSSFFTDSHILIIARRSE